MAFFSGNIYSYQLDKMTPINVYLPYDDKRRFMVNKPQKTLILLHGLEGNYSYWSRYTSVERYAQERNLALIMPDAEMSMYADMKCGQKYAAYIGQELPVLISKLFNLNTDRENLYIAGLSMGGYGAVRFALTYPQVFSKCSCFSGALMMGGKEFLNQMKNYQIPPYTQDYIEMDEIYKSMYFASKGAYGENFEYRPEDDILYLAQKAAENNCEMPEFLFTCGTEDFLYETNKEYVEKLKSFGLKITFDTWKGIHNWLFWEESIKKHIDFFN